MGITKEELQAQVGRGVPDLVASQVRLLFVGINPSLWTAAVQTHFAHPGNRFYKALYLAGITSEPLAVADGWTHADREALTGRGIGITNLVNRATARADELTADELRAGARALTGKVRSWRPAVVAVVGITAYRVAFGRRRAVEGRQDDRLGGAVLWVLPNPSGLNAHETAASLAAKYREAAAAAGVDLDPPRFA